MQNTYINKKAIILCFLWGVTILFFVSPDSYTHDLFYRWDTAWFYTCGKAWVEGLKPYVDFADSKGPLLWFIHGIAYIISPYNYLGIFWLSTIAYTIIFYYELNGTPESGYTLKRIPAFNVSPHGAMGYNWRFNASRSSRIYGNSSTVQPNSYTVYYIMRIR